jgi:hypothetical protein
MTAEKVRSVFRHYYSILGAHTVERGAKCKLCHVKWMLFEMGTWGDERLERMFRWLGFIQGVFWCEKVYTIDELKNHNREED